jgi:hypothetical protein
MVPQFVQVLDPQPPEGTAEVRPGGDGWIYAMPADPDAGALDWWETRFVPYQDDTGVWCLGDKEDNR